MHATQTYLRQHKHKQASEEKWKYGSQQSNRDVSFTMARGECCKETHNQILSTCKFRMNNPGMDVLAKCKQKE